VETAPFIRILLADRQEMFRDGLQRLLESEPGLVVVGGAGTAEEALRLVRDLDPDVLLLDLTLPGGSLELLKTLAAMPHRVRAIGLAPTVDTDAVLEALQCGARGVILKEGRAAVLLSSIRSVVADEYYIGPSQVGPVVERMRQLTQNHGPEANALRFKLTRRQIDIVEAVAAGESNKGIAVRLSISEDTVKHHVSNVFDKLGVFSRLELALFAINHKLVRHDDAT
jgi:two-component system, NarL family, nitrate/nitrite response regulator NarL